MSSSTILPCPECGGKRVSTSIQVREYGETFYPILAQTARTSNWFKGKTNKSDMQTYTCDE